MADEFRYPRTGDRVVTKFGDRGVMLGMASKPDPNRRWHWEGRPLDGGPFVIELEHGAVVGHAFDEVRLA